MIEFVVCEIYNDVFVNVSLMGCKVEFAVVVVMFNW